MYACPSKAAKAWSRSIPATLPGKLDAVTPAEVRPARLQYDLVCLAMQEPQYSAKRCA